MFSSLCFLAPSVIDIVLIDHSHSWKKSLFMDVPIPLRNSQKTKKKSCWSSSVLLYVRGRTMTGICHRSATLTGHHWHLICPMAQWSSSGCQVYQALNNWTRKKITIMLPCMAEGRKLPPYVKFKWKTLKFVVRKRGGWTSPSQKIRARLSWANMWVAWPRGALLFSTSSDVKSETIKEIFWWQS